MYRATKAIPTGTMNLTTNNSTTQNTARVFQAVALSAFDL